MKRLFYILIFCLLLVYPAFAATYYVSNAGDNTASGLSGFPWSHAPGMSGCTDTCDSTTLTGDDVVYLNKGDLWRDTITIPTSGTSGHQITFSSYGSGNLPKIYGSTEVSTWSTSGGNLWTATSASDPNSLWFVNTDESIVWGKDVVGGTPDAEYEWAYSGTTVTVYAASDPDSRYTSVEKATRIWGIDLNDKNYITVSYLDVSFCAQSGSTEEAGIYQDPGPNPGTYGLIIEYNKVHHNGTINPSTDDHMGNGIFLYNPNDSIIRNNFSYHNGRRGIVIFGNNAGRTVTNTIVEHNTIWNNTHASLDFFSNGGSVPQDGTIIRYNYLYTDANVGQGCLNGVPGVHGINIESNVAGRMTGFLIYNNVISEMVGNASMYIRGLESSSVLNNTIYSSKTYGGSLYGILINDNKAAGNATITLKNNIAYLVGGNNAALQVQVPADITACENNLWYNTGGQPFTRVNGTSYGAAQQAAYQSATGWDDSPNGLWEDPVFVTNGSDFNLQVASPAIDKGANLSGTFTDDYAGTARPQGAAYDIGAYEADAPAPVVVITTSDPTSISSNTLAISGTASDAVGVTECKFRIGAAPTESTGTAITGTTAWSGTATGFSEGANTLYVGCDNAANNWGSDSITVNFTYLSDPILGIIVSNLIITK